MTGNSKKVDTTGDKSIINYETLDKFKIPVLMIKINDFQNWYFFGYKL
jgi:hypothetical protein